MCAQGGGEVLTIEGSNSRGDLCSSSGERWEEDGNMTKVLKGEGMEGEDKVRREVTIA